MDDRGAREAVEESDRARERYLERFYQVGHELPTHYDLTLNTETDDDRAGGAARDAGCADVVRKGRDQHQGQDRATEGGCSERVGPDDPGHGG